MNMRKGLRRLAITFAVPYFGFWSLWAYTGNQLVDEYQPKVRLASASGIDFDLYNEGYDRLGAAMVYGLFWPFVALVVFAVAYWVYRGFKAKS